MLNIPSSNTDATCCYKMPRIITEQLGKGGSSNRTSISNIDDVALALQRPPEYLMRFFSSTLGACLRWQFRGGKGWSIDGHHESATFQNLLDDFISKYVLCEACLVPDTDLLVEGCASLAKCRMCEHLRKLNDFLCEICDASLGRSSFFSKSDRALKKCSVCGHATELRNFHRGLGPYYFAQFLVFYPLVELACPPASPLVTVTLCEDTVVGTSILGDSLFHFPRVADLSESQGCLTSETVRALRARIADALCAHPRTLSLFQGSEKVANEDAPWGLFPLIVKVDVGWKSSFEVKEQRAKEEKQFKQVENEKQLRCPNMKSVIQAVKDISDMKNGDLEADALVYELRKHQDSHGVDDKALLYIALESLFPSGVLSAKAIPEHTALIDKVIDDIYLSGADVLWAFGAYLSQHEKARKPFPMVLKTLYDEDWASEDDLLKYYNDDGGIEHPGFHEAKRVAAPFIRWLQTASYSDEDSD